MKLRIVYLTLLSTILIIAAAPAMARNSSLTMDRFIQNAATHAQWYISISQSEIQYFDNPDIRQLAQKILEQNRKISDELASIVASPSVGVEALGNYVDAGNLNMMHDAASKISPQDFEHRYVEMVQAQLLEDSNMYKQYAQTGTNASLKSVAAQNAPLFSKDYSEAYQFKTGHAPP